MMNEKRDNVYSGLELAIVGMSVRFPGAADYHEFWDNLANGVESVSFATKEEINSSPEYRQMAKSSSFVPCKGGVLPDKGGFDAAFFGYQPKEAELMDPQIRIFHEVTWAALEDAGYPPGLYSGRIGVFAGANSSYYWEVLTEASGKLAEFGKFEGSQLNTKDSMAKLLSYKFNLTGPSWMIHTNCSTSLVAVHQACRSLLLGECEMAVAGGVGIVYNDELGYLYQDGMIASPDGHCKAFDIEAGGTVGGEGCGVIVLKPLKKALADNDHIHAIIKGSAVNNDGNLKVGYTAPSVKGQYAVIRSALSFSKVSPASITYVETHGTATKLGDSIEVAALKKAYGYDRHTPCAIGSVKTNIGHLDSAAGIAGLVKTVLCLQHGKLVPSLHFNQLNPEIEMDDADIYVCNRLTEWDRREGVLRAGVSSFGIGGTNAHVILEEPPAKTERKQETAAHVLLVSAKSAAALDASTTRLADFIKQNPAADIRDLAFTLQTGRTTFPYKRMVLCQSGEEAVSFLETQHPQYVRTHYSQEKKKLVFLFPGQGAQYLNMAAGLYQHNTFFAGEIDKCAAIVSKIGGDDVLGVLFGSDEAAITATIHAQPLLFIVEYALARLLIRYAGEPSAMIGHSLGELVAACLSGVMELEDALKIVVRRGQVMQEVSHGAMLSILLPEEQLLPLLTGFQLDIAAVNTQDLCVVSGEEEEISAFESMLTAMGYPASRLPTSHASHSAMMSAAVPAFEKFLEDIDLKNPRIPFISSVTGGWIEDGMATSAQYWGQHILATVRFKNGVDTLLKDEQCIFVEVGPGNALSAFIKGHESRKPSQQVVNLLRHPKDTMEDGMYLSDKIGQLWLYGVAVNWTVLHEHAVVKRVPLPAYPFEHKRYWVDEDPFALYTAASGDQRLKVNDWFNYPAWQQSQSSGAHNREAVTWVTFIADPLLANSLQLSPGNCIQVSEGQAFATGNDGNLVIDPHNANDWERLMDRVNDMTQQPIGFIYSAEAGRGYYDLLYLCKAVGRLKNHHRIPLKVLLPEVHRITGAEKISPDKSAIAAAIRVIQQEFPSLVCQLIDIDGTHPATCRTLRRELELNTNDRVVAIRNGVRWTLGFRSAGINGNQAAVLVKPDGVYVITGGTGTVGLRHARFLLSYPGTKVVILGRRELSRETPGNVHQPADLQLLEAFNQLDPAGDRLYYRRADVGNYASLKHCLDDCIAVLGRIDGIIHAAALSNDKSTETGIVSLSGKDIDTQFYAKVQGAKNIAAITREIPVDFVLATSSLSAFLGGVGFYAYAASNAVLDTLAVLENDTGTTRWITVNWDGWSETPDDGLIDDQEAMEALALVLSDTAPDQLTVSLTSLQARIKKWIDTDFSATEDNSSPDIDNEDIRPQMTVSYKAPVSELHKQLADIWSEAFGYRKIGIDDDFFELGGNSLKMLMLIARIQKKLSASVSVDFFFKNPTISRISDYIDKFEEVTYKAIPKAEKREYYRLSSAQQKQFILQQINDNSTAYNETQVFRVFGPLDAKEIERAVNLIMDRHEILRTRITLLNEQPVQWITNRQVFRVAVSEIEEKDIEKEIGEFIRPFNLAHPPFLRIGIFYLKEKKEETILVVDMHHLVTDEVSFGNFVKELQLVISGQPLPPMDIQYKDYAMWQGAMKHTSTMEARRQFWMQLFEGSLPVLDLPYDFPRPALKTYLGERIYFALDNEENQALLAFCEKSGYTLYMFTLAVYTVLLSKLSGNDDIILGSPVSGRDKLEMQGLIGMFVNTLPLRLQLKREQTFLFFLETVKEVVISVFQHQDYPFEQLIEDLAVRRTPDRNPLFDVWFVLQNVDSEEAGLAGLAITPYDYNYASSKWDLTLQASQYGGQVDFMIEYNQALFRRETATAFSTYYLKMIREILVNPSICIDAINPLQTTYQDALAEEVQQALDNLSF